MFLEILGSAFVALSVCALVGGVVYFFAWTWIKDHR